MGGMGFKPKDSYDGLGTSVFRGVGEDTYEVEYEGASALEEALSKFFSYVFGWMFIGLMLTGIVAFFTVHTPLILLIARAPILLLGLILFELLLVFSISATASLKKVPLGVSVTLFLIYSALNGLTLSPIFLIYTSSSIAFTFLITSIMFAVLAVLGFINRRAASWGWVLLAALIALFIGELINLFFFNRIMYHILTVGGIVIFSGLTMYDMSKLRSIAERHIEVMGPNVVKSRAIMGAAIQGALALYLDFVNLFLYLLRFMGRRR